MILSIVIPFCDNDYQFLDGAVSSIKKHVKFDDYEIIAVDNREKDKSLINISNVKVVSKGYNLGCFDGRRFGVSYSQGTFIWNFDADDLMIGDLYREDIKEDADVMQMYYAYNTGTKRDQKMFPIAYGVNVWSRLYKAEIVKNFYAKLEKPIKIFMREDSLLFDAVCGTAKVWKYIPRIIYEYNFKNARFNKNNKNNNKKSKFSEQVAKETYENYKYVYTILGTPEKADILFKRVKEIAERGY